ncbi:hypothetical protein B9G69_015735 [Bdellovibrio sp. SKB1291214]|uniref:hypothetical protein n=1 Tax=Bdellovibrio sp. SKB1291214 TaxID=1732569 RepID=UPI000B51DD15|nr:hypothetical protein [Bdellovibrio sp. SKB1291214]UYL08494.1 hypothetical protein B9G69_015735 [Bdellovibrio sp. SKB1291214]
MNKKTVKFLFYVLPSMFLITVSFNNCGRYGDLEGSSDLSSTSSSSTPAEVTDSEALGIPYALLSAEQTFASMLRVSNVTTVSPALAAEYDNRYGALAAGNDLSMANPPLMLGATSLAGEVCNSVLTTEKAQAAASRAFFGSVNFATGVSSVTDAQFNSSVRGMARSYWGRNETAEELALLNTFKSEFITALAANARTQAASTSNLMLATCSAMLSSFDALSY